MNKKLKKNLIQYGVIGAVLLGLFFTGLHTEVFGFLQRGILQTGMMKPDVGQKEDFNAAAPVSKADFDLILMDSKGKQVDMEQFRGKVIFMNIWATWCPPCVAEMPGINGLYNKLEGEDVVFIMLSVDQDFEKAKEFNKRKGYDFEIYQPAGTIPNMYSTRSIPTTYVINANGDLALTHLGMGEYDTREFREFLLDQK